MATRASNPRAAWTAATRRPHEHSSSPSPSASESTASGRERRRAGKQKMIATIKDLRRQRDELRSQVVFLHSVVQELTTTAQRADPREHTSTQDGEQCPVVDEPLVFDLFDTADAQEVSVQTEISVYHGCPDVFISAQQLEVATGPHSLMTNSEEEHASVDVNAFTAADAAAGAGVAPLSSVFNSQTLAKDELFGTEQCTAMASSADRLPCVKRAPGELTQLDVLQPLHSPYRSGQIAGIAATKQNEPSLAICLGRKGGGTSSKTPKEPSTSSSASLGAARPCADECGLALESVEASLPDSVAAAALLQVGRVSQAKPAQTRDVLAHDEHIGAEAVASAAPAAPGTVSARIRDKTRDVLAPDEHSRAEAVASAAPDPPSYVSARIRDKTRDATAQDEPALGVSTELLSDDCIIQCGPLPTDAEPELFDAIANMCEPLPELRTYTASSGLSDAVNGGAQEQMDVNSQGQAAEIAQCGPLRVAAAPELFDTIAFGSDVLVLNSQHLANTSPLATRRRQALEDVNSEQRCPSGQVEQNLKDFNSQNLAIRCEPLPTTAEPTEHASPVLLDANADGSNDHRVKDEQSLKDFTSHQLAYKGETLSDEHEQAPLAAAASSQQAADEKIAALKARIAALRPLVEDRQPSQQELRIRYEQQQRELKAQRRKGKGKGKGARS